MISKQEQEFADLLRKTTPDTYDALRKKCVFDEAPAAGPQNIHSENNQISRAQTVRSENSRAYSRSASRIRKTVAIAAPAAAAAVFCLWLANSAFFLPEAVVTVDVNPSVSLELNSRNRVLSAAALNEDGEQILEGMDLKGTDVTVAVNALIGAMLQNGYLTEQENSVLLSISGKNETAGEELQSELMRSTRYAFSDSTVEGAVLSTVISGTSANEAADVAALVNKYQISEGKATLALEVASQTSTLTADDIAQMSINEINLLITSQKYTLTDLSSEGTASSEAYLTAEEAEALVFTYSDKSEAEAQYIQTAMDYNTGVVTYEVEFYIDSYKYEYEINATTGELLEWEIEWKNDELLAIELEELEKSQNVSGIGEERALEIALEHAGVDPSAIVFYSTVAAYEDGQEFYDVDFYTEDHEYDYKIDVLTGEILEYTYNRASYEHGTE
ncbi:MAG: PepSY domain-containing protein [Lachnospiraceae bacterium]|nr:PepSY domain-containing protein [Clostridiales bacterium]MCC8080500.1 PepSY domain-containing protein [Lachnospiraceae bacterium]